MGKLGRSNPLPDALICCCKSGIKEEDMISGHPEPETVTTGPPSLVLEITSQKAQTPLLIPVLAQTLSMGGVTVAVTDPWVIADWESYRGRECVLRLEGPEGQQVININAKISWSKFGGDIQSPLSVGLEMVNPPAEALKRLSDHLTHTSQDIKGLWERYDQVQEIPAYSHLMHHFYLVGLVLLLGGMVLQFTGSPVYKISGWVLWLLGSLGIAGKVMRSFRQKRVSQ
jgi:hypothetical protein